MRIDLKIQPTAMSAVGDIALDLDPEQVTISAVGDAVRFLVPVRIERSYQGAPPRPNYYPILLTLNGQLYYGQSFPGLAASLEVPFELPVDLKSAGFERTIGFPFVCSRSYLQKMEEWRAGSSSRTMTIGMSLWGIAAIVAETAASPATQSSIVTQYKPVDVTGFSEVRISNTYTQMSRSRWADLLESVGYPQRHSVELPIIDVATAAPEVKAAAEHLQKAYGHFVRDEYRQAVHFCRQARDALLTGARPTWASRVLTPSLGTEKAEMVNESIRSLDHLGHPASHGDSAVEIDRDTAEYVLGQLTLTLHYIDRKLR